MMAHHSDPTSLKGKAPALPSYEKKPRVLLAACGCVAVAKFGTICNAFLEWAEVKAVLTNSSFPFIDRALIPMEVTAVYTDEQEWFNWKIAEDNVPHIELSKWADIMVIAPLSEQTLAKIAVGLCDNLLTCVVRAWDNEKPMFVAPSMNSCTWENPLNLKHRYSIADLGIILIPPKYQTCAMAKPSFINLTVKQHYESKVLKKIPGYLAENNV